MMSFIVIITAAVTLPFFLIATASSSLHAEKDGDGADNRSEDNNLRKGPWTGEEDAVLAAYVTKHGTGNWNIVQKNTGLARCGKSCRLRWTNHLRPDLRRGAFNEEEQRKVLELHALIGNKWAKMAQELPGRTDNEIKNFWNTRLKKRKRMGLPIYPDDIKPLLRNANPEISLLHASTHHVNDSEAGPSSHVPHSVLNNVDINHQNQSLLVSSSISQLAKDRSFQNYNNQFQGDSMVGENVIGSYSVPPFSQISEDKSWQYYNNQFQGRYMNDENAVDPSLIQPIFQVREDRNLQHYNNQFQGHCMVGENAVDPSLISPISQVPEDISLKHYNNHFQGHSMVDENAVGPSSIPPISQISEERSLQHYNNHFQDHCIIGENIVDPSLISPISQLPGDRSLQHYNNQCDCMAGENATCAFDPSSESGSFDPLSELGSFDPSSELGSFDPLSELGSFDPSSELGSFDPSSELGSVDPLSELGSFDPLYELGSFDPSSELGAFDPSSELGSFDPSFAGPSFDLKPPSFYPPLQPSRSPRSNGYLESIFYPPSETPPYHNSMPEMLNSGNPENFVPNLKNNYFL